VGLDIISPEIVRVRVTLQKSFSTAPSLAVLPQTGSAVDWSVEEDIHSLTIKTEKLLLLIQKDTCAFTLKDSNFNLLLREPRHGGKHLHEIQVQNSGQPPTHQSRTAYSTNLEFEFADGEDIYGLGQHEEGTLILYRPKNTLAWLKISLYPAWHILLHR